MNKTQGIIFDLDGVLWSSSSVHENSFKNILSQLGITNFNYYDHAGMRTDEVLKRILTLNNIPFDDNKIEFLTRQKRALATELLNNTNLIYKDTISTITTLSKVLKLCIASSTRSRNIELFLKKSGLSNYFAFYVSGEDVINAKPSPENYHLAAEKMHLPKKSLIVVEDSISGIRASHAAQLSTIAITTSKSRAELTELAPYKIIDSLSDIVSMYE